MAVARSVSIVDLHFLQTDVTLTLNVPPTCDLYKPKSDIKLPSTDKLEAFRRLILSAKTGNIQVTDTISEVRAGPGIITSKFLTLVATQHIQEDFVRQRKADNATSPEELKQTITVARSVLFHLFS
jgi:hypothetical protein